MAERDPLLRLAARLAHGREIDWDAEERAAATDEEREGIRKLRLVAAMSALNRAVMSSGASNDLAQSISEAQSLATGAPVLAPGSRWGQLEVHERVGSGAFGEVYRARDLRLDREVALKILARDASDPRDEVIREARLLAAVRHPNVVMVHGADRIAGQVGIWTEFLRGQTLDRILRERGVLDSREAALIGVDICRALSAVHAAGIVHQDVKLSNVMRATGGRVVLMDFGLGREAEPMAAQEGKRRKLSGTPLFMAPEVLAGGRPDARSDLYSMGVLLFALVTGSLPVEASTLDALRVQHARGERRHARDLRPDLPESFALILDRALAADPRDRYQTAGEAEHALLTSLGAPGLAVEITSARWTGSEVGGSEVPGVHRLPAEIDAFVGREVELAALAERLGAEGARLVTLLGTGGIGKTRLAIRYAWQSRAEWPGGVWFCDLTEVRTRDGIASAVGEALGVPLGPLGADHAVARLGHAIANRGKCLFLLDNFEQVAGWAAETVAPWLERAPEARMLVTSRERLKVPGEEVLAIEALPIEHGVELFMERARRQRPIARDGSEFDSVREVVRLVEGIPLAIELSAARLRVMTPAQIVDRIAERFRILAGSGAGRHATLRAVIDSSWELLPPWEKAAFAQSSVFEGGFSLEAAEAVLDLSAWPAAPWVVDVLQSLVDKSLVRSWVPEADPRARERARAAVRFGMFVAMQGYAREKLAEEGAIPGGVSGSEAVSAAERRHGQWCARFGEEEAIDGLDRHGGVERRQALAGELDNLMAACRRMSAAGEGPAAVACYRAAWSVLELRGPLVVAVEIGTTMLEAPLERGDRARLLQTLGRAKQRAGRMAEARADLSASLAGFEECGDRHGEGRTRALLATLALNEGRIEEARAQLETALAVHREVGDRRAEGVARGNLGLAHHEHGELEEASVELQAALGIHRELGNRRSEGIVLGNLGNLRREQGRMEEAREHFEAALTIHREVGNRRFEGIVLGNLGSLLREQGRMEEARARYEAALAIHRQVGARRFEGEALDNVASVSFAEHRWEAAGAEYEASLAIHREVGNRRAEGIVLDRLGTLRLEQGRIAEAREILGMGESLLRTADYRVELAKLLCTRAELERRTGSLSIALATAKEVEVLAAQVAARSDSELGRRLGAIRASLGATGGPGTPFQIRDRHEGGGEHIGDHQGQDVRAG